MLSRLSFALACLIVALSLAPLAAQPATGPNPYAGILESESIAPTLGGMTAYLRALQPTDEDKRRQDALARKLIGQLGNDDFSLRETAQKALIAMPFTPTDLLQEAAKADDAEVADRAQKILDATRGKGDTRAAAVQAVLRTIQIDQVKGGAAIVLSSYPLFDRSHLIAAARDALVATAGPEDAELLRTAIHADNSDASAAAITALAAALGDRATPELLPLLNEKQEKRRLAAARAVTELGDRAGLPVLGDLLKSDDISIRLSADQILRSVSGAQFGFIAYESPEKRAAAAVAWRKWIEVDGRTAKLRLPLKLGKVELGRTLICLYAMGKVVEYDASGAQVWEQAVQGAMGGMGLPNGHRVISSYTGRFVVEFDEKGKEVWRQQVNGDPYNVERLDNGNTLVALYSTQRVAEYKPDGSIAWEKPMPGNPIDAQRLENGNTLVTLYPQKVIEVDPTGKTVGELGPDPTNPRRNNSQPIFARRLDTGNTLVCEIGSGSVVEYDATGKEVWRRDNLATPRTAQRLSDGTTLISYNNGAVIVDRAGKVVEEKRLNNPGAVNRY